MRTVMHPCTNHKETNNKIMVYGGSHSFVDRAGKEEKKSSSIAEQALTIHSCLHHELSLNKNKSAAGKPGLADTREPVSCLHPHQATDTSSTQETITMPYKNKDKDMYYRNSEQPYLIIYEKFRLTNAFPGEAPVSPSSGNVYSGNPGISDMSHSKNNKPCCEAFTEQTKNCRIPDRAPVSPLSGAGREEASAKQHDIGEIIFGTMAHTEMFCQQYKNMHKSLLTDTREPVSCLHPHQATDTSSTQETITMPYKNKDKDIYYRNSEQPYLIIYEKFRLTNAFPGEAPVSPSSGNAYSGNPGISDMSHSKNNKPCCEAFTEQTKNCGIPDRAPVSPLSGAGREEASAKQHDGGEIIFGTMAYTELFCQQYKNMHKSL